MIGLLPVNNHPEDTPPNSLNTTFDYISALRRILQVAQMDGKQQFTVLYHHVYNVDMLRESYYALKRKAAAGVNGETWQHYGENLEENLKGLHDRLKRGAYRAQPSKRSHVPKPDGRKRPIGVSALADKIAQRATATVLNAIYEHDFIGFSYGFRQERNPHNALDALYVGITKRKVNWVLDAAFVNFSTPSDTNGWSDSSGTVLQTNAYYV
jgi:hypothetical protein